jgi:hypothetical protein|tara:strand:- start:1044 stop:1328 length:285 start_codon:yes stop_codon:yes gene_type:complete
LIGESRNPNKLDEVFGRGAPKLRCQQAQSNIHKTTYKSNLVIAKNNLDIVSMAKIITKSILLYLVKLTRAVKQMTKTLLINLKWTDVVIEGELV